MGTRGYAYTHHDVVCVDGATKPNTGRLILILCQNPSTTTRTPHCCGCQPHNKRAITYTHLVHQNKYERVWYEYRYTYVRTGTSTSIYVVCSSIPDNSRRKNEQTRHKQRRHKQTKQTSLQTTAAAVEGYLFN